MNDAEQRNSTSGVIDGGGSDQFDARRQKFRALHEEGCFVMANPWDVGSARYLQHLGFPALATTSAGFAFSRGLPDSDSAVSRDQSLAHIAEIAAAVDVPVNADFASGYGTDPSEVADSVARCVATGVAGLSVEDATGERSVPLYDLPVAVERIRAARNRPVGRRRAADREGRVLPRRPPGCLPRIRAPPSGLRTGGSRCALRTGRPRA